MTEAILVLGRVWVPDVERMSPRVRSWYDPVLCRSRGVVTLAGTWTGVDRPSAARNRPLQPPYTVEMWVDEASTDAAHDDRARVVLRASSGTRPRLGDADVREVLWTGGRISARVTCGGSGTYLAQSLERAPAR